MKLKVLVEHEIAINEGWTLCCHRTCPHSLEPTVCRLFGNLSVATVKECSDHGVFVRGDERVALRHDKCVVAWARFLA